MSDHGNTVVRIASLFPHFATGTANSHVALSVCEQMRGPGVEVRLFQPASAPAARKPFTRDAVPPLLKSLAYRLASVESINRYAERVFLKKLGTDEVAFLWPAVTLDTWRAVHRRGNRIVIERINCHTGTSKR